jgi:hypothetical protein
MGKGADQLRIDMTDTKEALRLADQMDVDAEAFAIDSPRQAAAMLRTLAAEVEALRADAERYRYLRLRLVGADFDWAESGESVLIFKASPGVQVWADCDMTIDAARAALQGESK